MVSGKQGVDGWAATHANPRCRGFCACIQAVSNNKPALSSMVPGGACVTQVETFDRASPQTVKALLSLRDLILSGELRPGERISELSVVERLGVSRTPIRMALVRL